MYRRSTSLTPMALRAINYYMRGYTKAEAARKAGYAEASVEGNYEKFWKSKAVKAEIRERMRKLAVKSDIDVNRLVGWLRSMLDVDPSELVDEKGELKAPKDIAPDIARWLNWKMVRGKVVYESVDRLRIIELIMKLTGLSQETIVVKGEQDLIGKVALARQQLSLPAPKPILVQDDEEEVA